MAPQIPSRWHLKGTVTLACNCDYGCPCNFNARPTQGHCEGEWTWHVAEGRYADTPLDGLHFTSCLLRLQVKRTSALRPFRSGVGPPC